MSEHPYTNRLIHETSPYLLQHAHNPVDWWPWNDEALARARAEDRPILLSIGYSACHWCHVMEHESFENVEIARAMNERFICIKVDREERPDLDNIYQTVCQLLTRQGGWPLTMFLTPDLQPFTGGTYFPPEDRYGRPGFRRVLEMVAHYYHTNPDGVRDAATEISSALQTINTPARGAGEVGPEVIEHAASAIARAFDERHGGFGSQPKFPNTMSLDLFLRHWKRSGDDTYLQMVLFTLRKMAEGGIFDQVGGGFHRYSTDRHWLTPHFEKMLYDNALLARLYVQAYQASGDPFLKGVAERTLDYVMREMTSPDGGFYSTQDADSEGEEGKFFVWTPSQVEELLGQRDGAVFCAHYGITPEGNFEHGTSIPHITRPLSEVARSQGLSVQEAEQIVDSGRQRLFTERERRIKPFRDDKILTCWNALMISAFAEAARVLDNSAYLEAANRAAAFLRDELYSGTVLRRFYREGSARGEGFLDDYAYAAAGLLDLYEASHDLEWLQLAARLNDTMRQLFRDSETGDFFQTPAHAGSLIVRPRQNDDPMVPSAVSIAAMNLCRLSALMAQVELRDEAERIFAANAVDMNENPHGVSNLICAYDYYLSGPVEILVWADPSEETARQALLRLNRVYQPNRVLAVVRPGDPGPPMAEGRKPLEGTVTAYVCRDFTCSAPMTSWEELEAAMAQ